MATILGAGAVGLALGARLGRAGEPLRFGVRRPEAAERLRSEGLVAEDPSTGEVFRAPAEARVGLVLPEPDEALLLCVRLPDVSALATQLGAAAPWATVACFQNDVEAEALVARRVRRVLGVVWRETSTRVADHHVRLTGTGRAVVGLHPQGEAAEAAALAERLRAAGISTGLSPRIGADKWLKLCVNLMSAPNALVRRDEHATAAFVDGKARLLEEARDALAAAGVEARSCDGRDRSLDEEIRHQRESLQRGTSARSLPLFNQVWAGLRRGGPVEAEAYHRRILGLAARHGVPAPTNERVLHLLERAVRRSLGPECYGAAELLGEPSAASSGAGGSSAGGLHTSVSGRKAFQANQ